MYRTFPLLAVLFLLAAAPVGAQAFRPERPYRGLFGGNDSASQGLSVAGSLGGGFGRDLALNASGLRLPEIDRGNRFWGASGQVSGSLLYTLSRAGATLSASANTAGRYYPSATANRLHRRHSAAVQGSIPLPAGFSVDGQVSYAPFRIWDLYSTAAPARSEASDAFDFESSSAHHLAYSGSLEGGWRLSRRLSVGVDYRHAGRAASIDIPDHASHSAGANMRYNLGRGLDLKLGYDYSETGNRSGRYVRHVVNAGLDFSRALSFSRRTTLSFSTGTAAAGTPSSAEGLRYSAVGDVALSHEIGRTWAASVSYSRRLRITEYWFEPIFSDVVSAAFTGLVNRRVQVHSRGGATNGHVSTENSTGFDAYFADAGLTLSINRYAGFGTSYRYYHHQFSETFRVLPGMPPTLGRHSLHAYVTVWAPIFQSARRP